MLHLGFAELSLVSFFSVETLRIRSLQFPTIRFAKQIAYRKSLDEHQTTLIFKLQE